MGRKSKPIYYTETEAINIYLAGLFDGEGCVTYSNGLVLRKGKKKAYPTWNIRLEIAMTCQKTIQFAFDNFGCGHMNFRPKAAHQNFDQYLNSFPMFLQH